MLNRFDEQLDLNEYEQYWVESFRKMGATIQFETKSNGVRTIKITKNATPQTQTETKIVGNMLLNHAKVRADFENALKTDNRQLIQKSIFELCLTMGISIRGISFEDSSVDCNDSVLYIDVSQNKLDYESVIASIQKLAKNY